MKRKFVIAIAVMMSLSLVGCGNTTSSEIITENIEETVAEEVVEDSSEEEVVTKEIQAEEVEPEEDVKQTLDEWVDSLNLSEFKYCIWSDSTGKGIVLEDNQVYNFKKGDKILIYKPQNLQIYSMTLPNESSVSRDKKVDINDRYNILNLVFYNSNIQFQTIIESTDGEEYLFNFDLVIDEIESIDELSGEEWLNIIHKKNPEFVVWNNETGTKKEIQNGEEYQLQEGDTIAIYYGWGYVLQEIEPADCKTDYQSKYIGIILPPSQNAIEYKAKLVHYEDMNDVVEINFTLLPQAQTLNEMSGTDWAYSLTTKEPELLIWNDTTGTKLEIMQGSEYQLKEGDEFAVYYGGNCYLEEVIYPDDCKIDYQVPYARLVYDVKEPTEFVVVLANQENENDLYEVRFTLLPIE